MEKVVEMRGAGLALLWVESCRASEGWRRCVLFSRLERMETFAGRLAGR